jgi:heat shock protein HslJ
MRVEPVAIKFHPAKIGLWGLRLVVSSFAGANMFCSRGEDRPVKLSAVGGAPATNRLQCPYAASGTEGSRRPRGTSWQLVKFQSSDDKTLTPDDPAKYTIAFGTDGSVSVRIDCNRGRGAWNLSGPNQLQFGPLALTRAQCPPSSLYDRIVEG